MMRFARSLVLSVATAAVVSSAIPPAEARDRGHRQPRIERQHDRVGEVLGAGIIGLAIGAIVVGILSEQRADHSDPDENPYRHPRPAPVRPYFPAAPAAYQGGRYRSLEPWSPGWYRYCAARYRSFVPSEGTFTTYSGEKRFCVAE